MPNGRGGDWGPAGQREVIRRGERTDPRSIMAQAAGGAICGDAFIFVVMGAALILALPTLDWLADNWRWMLCLYALPWLPYLVAACCQLWIEIFDPHQPAPRKAADTTRPIMPWSKERRWPQQPRRKPDYLVFGEGEE